MDADILRLILFVAGIALVLGIYFWDRHKRTREREDAMRQDPQVGEAGNLDMSLPRDGDWEADPDIDLEQELKQLDDILSEEREESRRHGAAPPPSEKVAAPAPRQRDLFGFRKGEGAKPQPPAPQPDLPVKILQINVVARGAYFEGNDLLRAANETGMKAGDMRIFHRLVGAGKSARPIFSMANLVEPGNFPVDAMGDFTTPGVVLFAKLPGPRDGLAVFSDMLFTAERIASILDGELQDETHSALTKQTIEHVREEILEHRRKVRLLQMKR